MGESHAKTQSRRENGRKRFPGLRAAGRAFLDESPIARGLDRLIERRVQERIGKYLATELGPRYLAPHEGGGSSSWDVSKGTDAYGMHVWLFVSVRAIATRVAGIDRYAYRVTLNDEGQVEHTILPSHPVSILLTEMNPHQTGMYVFDLSMTHLLLTGKWFWGVEQNPQTSTGWELWVLHPSRMKVLGDAREYIKGYRYEVSGRSVDYDAAEVIYMRFPDPREGKEFEGMSPIEAATLGLSVDLYAQAGVLRLFENGMRPLGTFETDQNIGDPEFERFQKQINDEHAGAARWGKNLFLDKGVKYQRQQMTPAEFAFTEIRKLNREEVTAAIGALPIELGLLEGMTFNNAEMQRAVQMEQVDVRYLKPIDAMLTMRFRQLGLLAEDEIVKHDTTRVKTEALTIDRRSLSGERAIRTGQLSPNEARRIFWNMPPYEGGDTYFFMMNQVPTAPPEEAAKLLGGKSEVKSLKSENDDGEDKPRLLTLEDALGAMRDLDPERQAWGWQLRNWNNLVEKRSKPLVWLHAGHLTELAKETYLRVLEALEEGVKNAVEIPLFDPYTVAREWWTELKPVMGEIFLKEYEAARMISRQKTGTRVPEMEPGENIEEIIPRVMDLFFDKIVDIAEDLKERIKTVVSNGLLAGEDAQTIARSLRRIPGFEALEQVDVSPVGDIENPGSKLQRAIRIARTETTGLLGAATNEAYKTDPQVIGKRWLAMLDDRTRDHHIARDGIAVAVEEAWVGPFGEIRYPGDPAADAEEVVMCRCGMTSVLQGENL